MSAADKLVAALAWLPPWFVVIFISMIPFVELRGAIPVAVAVYDMDIVDAYILAVIGNMIPVPFILLFLDRIEDYMRRYGWWDRLFDRVYAKTRNRAKAHIKRYEAVGVILFVAIPLPMTGAWTGSLIAYLFDLDFKKSILYIFLGVLIAGCIVSLMTIGALSFT